MPAGAQFAASAADVPDTVGAYLLVITLPTPLCVSLPGRTRSVLLSGRYLYAGSARGPGGLRARVARHLRTEKRTHWHVDLLTARGAVEGAWIVRDGTECDFIVSLSHLPVPLPGFGSSDCRTCRSHLLRWQ
ncbi:MAG: GIY-YIG nuclease family protein [Proteobacteria bacterium]|nr:GIY-YIG nuclease family protein [Pseudomonadota bacterium]